MESFEACVVFVAVNGSCIILVNRDINGAIWVADRALLLHAVS